MKPAAKQLDTAPWLASLPDNDARRTEPTIARSREAHRRARVRWRFSTVIATVSALTVVICTACALFPEAFAPYAPTEMHTDSILQAPGGAYLLGTDQFGRDVLSLVIYGARQSLAIGVFAVLISGSLGLSLGLVAGYSGGVIDMVIMRLIDIWLAIPNILLAIAIATALDPSLRTTILAVSVVGVPRFARIMRGQALAVRAQPFIQASRAAGSSHLSILWRHVLPHCMAPAVVMATLMVGTSILLGTSLSFLGLGVNDERPDWGYLLTQGRGYLTVAWWTVTFPGLAITALVVSVNLLGDALRRRVDPRRAPQ